MAIAGAVISALSNLRANTKRAGRESDTQLDRMRSESQQRHQQQLDKLEREVSDALVKALKPCNPKQLNAYIAACQKAERQQMSPSRLLTPEEVAHKSLQEIMSDKQKKWNQRPARR